MELFLNPDAWIALLTLTFLEIVLGIDNIVFISIAANKLPEHQRAKATNIGLVLAMVQRIALLSQYHFWFPLRNHLCTLIGVGLNQELAGKPLSSF